MKKNGKKYIVFEENTYSWDLYVFWGKVYNALYARLNRIGMNPKSI